MRDVKRHVDSYPQVFELYGGLGQQERRDIDAGNTFQRARSNYISFERMLLANRFSDIVTRREKESWLQTVVSSDA